VGSAGFLVVYLTVFAAFPQLSAQLMNLIFFISSSVAAIAVNLVKKRLRWMVILPVSVAGAVGAFGGASFAHSVDTDFLGKAFAVMLIVFGAVSLFGKKKTKTDPGERKR
jgi:uncharacterized membrane protein YfcA